MDAFISSFCDSTLEMSTKLMIESRPDGLITFTFSSLDNEIQLYYRNLMTMILKNGL